MFSTLLMYFLNTLSSTIPIYIQMNIMYYINIYIFNYSLIGKIYVYLILLTLN